MIIPSRRALIALLLLAFVALPAAAQRVLLDQGTRAAGLWCFPVDGDDPHVWVYIPAGAKLATDASGQPKFSFVRYVISRPAAAPSATPEGAATATAATSASTIVQAEGGGVLTLLVEIDTPAASIADAQQALREIRRDNELVLRGPMIFKDGRYSLISSILLPSAAKPERKLLATGRAPVLEGNQLALSFELEAQQSTLLLESLKQATPDVSIAFDMTFEGLTAAYDAQLTIDWSQVQTSLSGGAGGTIYFVSADVEATIDNLLRNNAIKLTSRGSDAATEGLLQVVYNKLLELLFTPVEPEQLPADQRGGLADALGALIDPRSGILSSRQALGFGAYVNFRMKDLRSTGRSVLDFNHRATQDRHALLAWNLGDLWTRVGNDPKFVRVVDLSDPTFQRREIAVTVDGSLAPEFAHAVNSVTVALRKRHGSGEETLDEVLIDGQNAATQAPPKLTYGSKGDVDREAWLAYEVRTRWSFQGGGAHQTEWTPADGAMIALFAPYERRTIEVIADRPLLLEKGVRAVVVKIDYPFLSGPRSEQRVIRPASNDPDPVIEVTLPRGRFDYEYTLTWMLADGGRRTTSARDTTGVIFVDGPPSP